MSVRRENCELIARKNKVSEANMNHSTVQTACAELGCWQLNQIAEEFYSQQWLKICQICIDVWLLISLGESNIM